MCAAILQLFLCLALGLAPGGAGAGPLPGQHGLPSDLILADQPPLREQAQTLRKMTEWLQENAPQGGFMDKVKGFFGGGPQTVPLVNIPLLPLNSAQVNGKMIAVQGVFVPGTSPGTASMTSEGITVVLSLAPGVARAGLPEKLDGLPLHAEGVAEALPNGNVSLRVQKLQPAGSLTYLRLGRAAELGQGWDWAVWAYNRGAQAAQREGYLLGAYGATQAAFITLHKMKEERAARALLSTAWSAFTVQDKGVPRYHTWVQKPEGDWERLPASKAIAPTLKSLEESGFWYKLVDFFVVLSGGNAALGFLLLAVMTRLLVYPLTKKQLSSARDMQRLQPLMKKLQDKYKNDKQKFQEEFWKLCKEHGVNPLGGCLPMLVQMPLLFFVYAGIRAYIVNLDTQGFFWVHSLAQPDFGLLVLYTVSQVLFGKLTQSQNPQAALDPQQKQQQQMMTYMMPIMFFFLFQSFPAGFMLYWLGTNVVYIVQQYWFNYTAGPLQCLEERAGGEDPAPSPSAPATSKGGWMSRLTASPPPQDPQELQSFEKKKARAAGKMTSREEAEKQRKRRRRPRT